MSNTFLSIALALAFWGCGTGSMTSDSDGGPGTDALESLPDGSVADAGPRPDAQTGTDGGTEPPRPEWPIPVPGEPGTGPACAAPPQAEPGDWPEVFVGVDACDDGGDGTRAAPFCTFERAFEVADTVPYIVTVLDGTYRERGNNLHGRAGSPEEYFLLRADEGATPVVLGSTRIEGADFEESDGLHRVDVSSLDNEPTGFWTTDGTRMDHVMEMRDGVRSHAHISDLTEPGQWTKADASGVACEQENDGCYIYLRVPAAMNLAATSFEASQGPFITSRGSHYLTVDGIHTRFTQSTAMFFEGSEYILIQNGDFAHNANSNDNSYNLRLWGAQGAHVRNNRVSDSEYWGGGVNSHGITFMITGNEADIWVCGNEMFDSIGNGVGTKGGSSNVHVVGNWFHDLGIGVLIPGERCHWRGCDVEAFPGGAYTVRENYFENCEIGVDIHDRAFVEDGTVLQSRVYNNLFADTDRGVRSSRVSTQPYLRNNLFMGTGRGIQFQAGGTDTWPDFYLAQGFDSNNNLFSVDASIYVQANWSGLERAFTVEEYNTEYGAELNSIEASPNLGDRFVPQEGSPALGAGDGTDYDRPSVNIGLWPTL